MPKSTVPVPNPVVVKDTVLDLYPANLVVSYLVPSP